MEILAAIGTVIFFVAFALGLRFLVPSLAAVYVLAVIVMNFGGVRLFIYGPSATPFEKNVSLVMTLVLLFAFMIDTVRIVDILYAWVNDRPRKFRWL